jgi:hypothetical protein
MGADRLFRDHAPEKRKRKRRLIDLVHPEMKQGLKKVMDDYSPETKRQLIDSARQSGVSVENVHLYVVLIHFISMTREERLRAVREHDLFPGVPDDEIERAMARLEQQFSAEMRANKRRMESTA